MNDDKITHVKIAGGNILTTAFLEKLITIPVDENTFIIKFEEQKTVGLLWQLRSNSFVSIEITHRYYLDFLTDRKEDIFYQFLQDRLKPIWDIFKKRESEIDITSEYGIEKMQVLYYSSGAMGMHFRYTMSLNEDEEKNAWDKMINIVRQYESADEKMIGWLKSVQAQKDELRYFQFDRVKGDWTLSDPLEKVVGALSFDYFKKKKDTRIRKPHIVVNEDKFNEHYVWDQQWDLNFEKSKIILPPPNDIALYVSMADKNLSKAKEVFYKEYKKFRQPIYNPLLRDSEAEVIYDYFELIIAAIIFSYTAIETLANICIIDKYQHVEEKDDITTIYSRNAIERKFKLRDKLKKILREILKTTDPTSEKWWENFINLEDVRNELVHVKKGKSQEIFSTLLSNSIFKTVEATKEIITYYGFYINQNQRNILIDFPYNFGSDSVKPYFMTEKDYWTTWQNMHNPYINDPENTQDDSKKSPI